MLDDARQLFDDCVEGKIDSALATLDALVSKLPNWPRTPEFLSVIVNPIWIAAGRICFVGETGCSRYGSQTLSVR